jgi:hypothetical protein
MQLLLSFPLSPLSCSIAALRQSSDLSILQTLDVKFPSFGGRRLRVGQNSQAVRRNVPQGVAFVGAGRWSLTDSG